MTDIVRTASEQAIWDQCEAIREEARDRFAEMDCALMAGNWIDACTSMRQGDDMMALAARLEMRGKQ
jgi:hypothetical protein